MTMDLLNFIAKERERFEVRHNNMFAFSLNSVLTYKKFLDIIIDRNANVTTEFIHNNQAIGESIKRHKKPRGSISQEEMKLFLENEQISLRLHLEIESFYLFAKILLDKISRSLEFYFGAAHKHPLDSHDDLAKNIEVYSKEKKLKIDAELISTIQLLKHNISDFRDYAIAHEKSPRTLRYYSINEKGARMILNTIYPKESDQLKESINLEELHKNINQYINQVVEFIRSNSDKTNLTLKK